MLCIRGHRSGSTEAIELDTLRLRHQRHCALQLDRVELLAHFHQSVQRGVENLQAVVGDGVIFVDRELAEAGAGGQALRQFQFEILKAGTTDGAAEAHDGRLADADAVSQVGHGTVHHCRRVKQHVVGDLELRLA